LTRAPKAYDAYPRWSPNGEWIAFHRKGKSRGQWNIWIVHPDGTGETQLTDGRRESSNPSWSPDSRRIVFQVYRPDPDTYDVALVDVATRQVTPVTQTDQVTEEYPVWIK
jgi:Tol biopolymer transport system component